jgi:hypothetical protein
MTGLALTGAAVLLVLVLMRAVAWLERWSKDAEVRAAQLRAEEALIMNHPGADEEFERLVREWRETDQAWAEYDGDMR